VVGGGGSGIRRGDERRPRLIAADNGQPSRDIAGAAAPKQRGLPFEQAPEADPRLQPSIVEQKCGARGSVCADDALVVVASQQHSGTAVVRRRGRDDPLAPEAFPESPLLDGARRCDRQRARQGVRPFRSLRIDSGYVEHRDQSSIGAENGRARTTEVHVPRSIMLAAVDRNRPFFTDTGADPVRSLDRLVPYATEPGAPVTKPVCIAVIAAMLDRDPGIVAEQKRIARLTDHAVKAIEFVLSAEHKLVERLAMLADLVGG